MPEKPNDRKFVPEREYNIKLQIGDLDFSNDLIRVQLMSSIQNPYITVALELFIDINDAVDYLNSEKKFKLNVVPLTEEASQGNTFETELLYLKSDLQVVMKAKKYKDIQDDRVRIKVITVPKKSFEVITTLVNNVYLDKTVSEIVQDLVNNFTKGKVKIDNSGINSNKITQVLIPPMTLYKSILYLDKYFGLYNGPSNISCVGDQIFIHNLSKEFSKSFLTIYQLSEENQENDTVIQKCVDGKKFYTYDPIVIQDNSTSKLANLSEEMNFIVNPSDTLYKIIQEKTSDISKKFSLTPGNSKSKIGSISSRKRYINNFTGYQDSDYSFVSSISSDLTNLIAVNLTLNRNLWNINNLLKTGSPTKLNPSSLEYVIFAGQYILESTNILFVKRTDWRATCSMSLIRTCNNM